MNQFKLKIIRKLAWVNNPANIRLDQRILIKWIKEVKKRSNNNK